MIIKQISVFVENRPGRLAEITAMIAGCGVNIRALSIADTSHFGIMRCIVDKPEVTEAVLRNAGLTVAITDVIGLRIPDCPGGLAEALKFLADKGFTVEYAYAFIEKTENDAYVVLRIDDAERAVKVLKANGYKGAEPSKQ